MKRRGVLASLAGMESVSLAGCNIFRGPTTDAGRSARDTQLAAAYTAARDGAAAARPGDTDLVNERWDTATRRRETYLAGHDGSSGGSGTGEGYRRGACRSPGRSLELSL